MPKTVQRIGASRFAPRQIERQRRLGPIADLCVSRDRTSCSFGFQKRFIRLRTVAEMKEHVPRFTKHFGIPEEPLFQGGLRDGGDFKIAAQFLRSCF